MDYVTSGLSKRDPYSQSAIDRYTQSSIAQNQIAANPSYAPKLTNFSYNRGQSFGPSQRRLGDERAAGLYSQNSQTRANIPIQSMLANVNSNLNQDRLESGLELGGYDLLTQQMNQNFGSRQAASKMSLGLMNLLMGMG